MSHSAHNAVLWAPRILGILCSLFIGMFALDAVSEGLVPFLIHLSPAILMLIVVALSWRWEWIGAAVFIALAALYAAMTIRRPDWILVISGPLLIVGGLFLLSWQQHRRELATTRE